MANGTTQFIQAINIVVKVIYLPHLTAAGDNLRQTVETATVKRDEAIDLKAVKEALNLERDVPGADLVVNRFSLDVR